MTVYAKDIMVASFEKVHENAPVKEAIQLILNGKVRETGYKSISLVVVNGYKHLAGVVTMYDILYHLRPEFLNYGISADQLSWSGQLKNCIDILNDKKVKQVMSKTVVGASGDEHIMVILDRMIKHKYRRLPVLENNRPIGVIYMSDIYCRIFKKSLV
ncbi:MAG: CBS domain-containing protein [Pseudomonadota bacterium]